MTSSERPDMTPKPIPKEADNSQKPDFIKSLEILMDRELFVCVGIDPDLREFIRLEKENPGLFKDFSVIDNENIVRFIGNRIIDIIDATSSHAAAYKPNAAFFEAMGDSGRGLLSGTLLYLNEKHRQIPNILDVKRGDIGNTQEKYAQDAFENLGAKAATVNPYMSDDAVLPFAQYKEKGVFPLVRTSNSSAAKTQDVLLADGRAYWELMAEMVRDDWNENGNIGIVMGATNRSQLLRAREIVGPDIPILAPGVGAQGGSIEDVVAAGNRRFVVNASRSIMYPKLNRGESYKDGVRRTFLDLHNQIQTSLKDS